MRRWIETVSRARAAMEAPAPPLGTLEEGAARLARSHPDLPFELLRRRAGQLTREVPGGFRWKFDPLHATTSPSPFYARAFEAFARAVTSPVLHVSGGATGHHVPDEEARLACFASLTRVTLPGGHMLHWSKPGPLAEAILSFARA
jgi:pimeloyl-ACP methyl ester carboxylesterase